MRISDHPIRSATWIAARLAITAFLGLASIGCFNPFRPEVSNERLIADSGQAPRPTSSRNVMKLFRWCWENQNITLYDEIFTDDFRFAFAEADSEGNRFPGHELQRLDEVESARHLFVGGGAGEPPANSISMEFRSPLIPDADPRPGKEEPWHVKFQTDVDIAIRTDAAVFRILSKAVFYVVRGDSADVPRIHENLPDEDRKRYWYIERYEEIGPAALVAPVPLTESRGAGKRNLAEGPPSGAGSLEKSTADARVSWGWIKGRFR